MGERADLLHFIVNFHLKIVVGSGLNVESALLSLMIHYFLLHSMDYNDLNLYLGIPNFQCQFKAVLRSSQHSITFIYFIEIFNF